MRGEQTEIPGAERKRWPAIESAAEEYRDVRDRRMELTESEVNLRAKLLKLMRERDLTVYRTDDGRVVEVVEGEAVVKVRKGEEPKANGAADA